jgi:hypothetical protein
VLALRTNAQQEQSRSRQDVSVPEKRRVIGYVTGRDQALRLELDAQLALCQVEIERHTRESAPAA